MGSDAAETDRSKVLYRNDGELIRRAIQMAREQLGTDSREARLLQSEAHKHSLRSTIWLHKVGAEMRPIYEVWDLQTFIRTEIRRHFDPLASGGGEIKKRFDVIDRLARPYLEFLLIAVFGLSVILYELVEVRFGPRAVQRSRAKWLTCMAVAALPILAVLAALFALRRFYPWPWVLGIIVAIALSVGILYLFGFLLRVKRNWHLDPPQTNILDQRLALDALLDRVYLTDPDLVEAEKQLDPLFDDAARALAGRHFVPYARTAIAQQRNTRSLGPAADAEGQDPTASPSETANTTAATTDDAGDKASAHAPDAAADETEDDAGPDAEAQSTSETQDGSVSPEPTGAGHFLVFVSYVREDGDAVDRLCAELRTLGLNVWQDKTSILPGDKWREVVRRTIDEQTDIFLACFSNAYLRQDETYMNEELVQAKKRMRGRSGNNPWFIPVLLDDCEIPGDEIAPGETWRDYHAVDLHADWEAGVQLLAETLKRLRDAKQKPLAD